MEKLDISIQRLEDGIYWIEITDDRDYFHALSADNDFGIVDVITGIPEDAEIGDECRDDFWERLNRSSKEEQLSLSMSIGKKDPMVIYI